MGCRNETVHYAGMKTVSPTYLYTAKKHEPGGRNIGQKWLQMNEAVAFKRLVRCSKTIDLRQLGIFYIRSDVGTPHKTIRRRGGIVMVVTTIRLVQVGKSYFFVVIMAKWAAHCKEPGVSMHSTTYNIL